MPPDREPRLLFVTWDGPGQPYLESLFLPQLSRLPFPTSVLQYTYGSSTQLRSAATSAKRWGVGYRGILLDRSHQGRFARRLFATARAVRSELERTAAQVVISRSVIAGGLSLLSLGTRSRVPLVFDADGLMTDERVDFAGWSRFGASYLTLRGLEALLVSRCSATVARTEAGARTLGQRALLRRGPLYVVGNGKDVEMFRFSSQARKEIRGKLGIPSHAPVVGYVGSHGTQYLPERMLEFFRRVRARRRDAVFVILSHQPEAWPKHPGLRVASVHPDCIPQYISAFDVGLAFRLNAFSQRAVAPIKVAEYLLCGCPVVSSRGIGDLHHLCEGSPAVRFGTDPEDLDGVVAWFLEMLQRRELVADHARSLGLTHFDVDEKARAYAQIIEEVWSCRPGGDSG